MSGLYRYFLTTVLFMAIAVFTTHMFYSHNLSHTPVREQNSADRTYVSTDSTFVYRLARNKRHNNLCPQKYQKTMAKTVKFGTVLLSTFFSICAEKLHKCVVWVRLLLTFCS